MFTVQREWTDQWREALNIILFSKKKKTITKV